MVEKIHPLGGSLAGRPFGEVAHSGVFLAILHLELISNLPCGWVHLPKLNFVE
jgi:hypothetical protein